MGATKNTYLLKVENKIDLLSRKLNGTIIPG
jgi:hypothetical protein